MNFDFSEDQYAIGASLSKLLEKLDSLAKARQVLDGQLTHSEEIWAVLTEAKYHCTAVPEYFGGIGLGYLELCIVSYEIGKSLAAIPFTSSVCLAMEILKVASNDDRAEACLRSLCEEPRIATALIGSPQKCRFDGLKLNGSISPLADGVAADVALVRLENELVLVDLNNEETDRTALGCLDPTQGQAKVVFSGTPAWRLNIDYQSIESIIDRAAILVAFQQLGLAESAQKMAIDEVQSRHTFGRKIGSFQAIKHKLADTYIQIEIARAHCYYAAWALSQSASDLPSAAASARISASRASNAIARELIQVHGAMGFTWESDCHLFYRRARHLSLILGAESRWKKPLISSLADGDTI